MLTHLDTLGLVQKFIPPTFVDPDLGVLAGSDILLSSECDPYAADHVAKKEHVAHEKVNMLIPVTRRSSSTISGSTYSTTEETYSTTEEKSIR